VCGECAKVAKPTLLARAVTLVKRVAAVETGAIEKLYPTDRGFTIAVALEAHMWAEALTSRGSTVRALFIQRRNRIRIICPRSQLLVAVATVASGRFCSARRSLIAPNTA
jgi:hypothetical protein